MTKEFQHNQIMHKKQKRKKVLSAIAKTLVTLVVIALVGYLGFTAYRISMSRFQDAGNSSSSASTNSSQDNLPESSAIEVSEKTVSSATVASSSSDESSSSAEASSSSSSSSLEDEGFPIPLLATFQEIKIHSPVHPKDLEGILFHQASFETAYVLSTELPSADPGAMEADPNYQIAEKQPTGDEWMDALALHLWRDDTPTDMDTSIDVGAEAGAQVYAPVTGTVVKVGTYRLYDTCDDYEIHIQPDGRRDLDVVEIHVDNVTVKEGDKVVGGVTPMAVVRDLAAEDITDIQLAYYTKEGHGNHTHVQVNNADYPEYRETRLKDAYEVK